MQGMRALITTMGMRFLNAGSAQRFESFGVRQGTDDVVVDIAGHMLLDITGFVAGTRGSRRLRRNEDLWRCRDKSGAPDTRDPRLSPRREELITGRWCE